MAKHVNIERAAERQPRDNNDSWFWTSKETARAIQAIINSKYNRPKTLQDTVW